MARQQCPSVPTPLFTSGIRGWWHARLSVSMYTGVDLKTEGKCCTLREEITQRKHVRLPGDAFFSNSYWNRKKKRSNGTGVCCVVLKTEGLPCFNVCLQFFLFLQVRVAQGSENLLRKIRSTSKCWRELMRCSTQSCSVVFLLTCKITNFQWNLPK